MQDDYLWDKTGEPDDEVQLMEEILAAFKHRPEPLTLPAPLVTKRPGAGNLTWIPVAAAALLIIGLGVRIGLNRPQLANQVTGSPAPIPGINPSKLDLPVEPKVQEPPVTKVALRSELSAGAFGRRAAERRGRIAREKVLYAFQITSSKMQLIDRKLQTDLN